MRWLALGTLLLALLTVPACGDSGKCGPSSCAGCCNNGKCVFDYKGCGQAGANCSVWRQCVSTQECKSGQCVDKLDACNQTNCSTGCCVNGQCMSGNDMNYCGRNGGPCFSCTPPEQQCVGGACTGSTACGPGKCGGCCNGPQCMPGTDITYCGKGGVKCTPCSPLQCMAGVCKSDTACNTTNCASGCCFNGVCMGGDSSGMCGTGAVACVDCTKKGQACNPTIKQCASGTCGPGGTVPCTTGCCDSTGKCVPGLSITACGKGGVGCADCTKLGSYYCNASTQSCQPGTPPTCNSSNCPGCCDTTTGSCVAMPDPSGAKRCGTGGAVCKTCGSSQECIGGNCMCTAAACPTGCCSPAPNTAGSTCAAGTTNTACGTLGQTCQQCTGGICNQTTRQCQGSCTNCTGPNCCGVSAPYVGQCTTGYTDTNCGTSGNQCVNCLAIGQTCILNQCVPKSYCTSCGADQCCSGGTSCVTGTFNSSCGGYGAPCDNCSANYTPAALCDSSSKTCTVNPSSLWKVELLSVTLNTGYNFDGYQSDPQPWDPPEPYVKIWVGSKSDGSSTKAGYDVSWNYEPMVTNVPASALTAVGGLRFQVWDSDWPSLWDQFIADCFDHLTTELLYSYTWADLCWHDVSECDPAPAGESNSFSPYYIKEICFHFSPM